MPLGICERASRGEIILLVAPGWIAQTLREAAWAPLLVFCLFIAAAGILDAYTRFPSLDIPTHFLGGAAVTYFFRCAFANAQSVAGLLPNVSPAGPAFGCTAGTTILWELFEFLSDRLVGSHLQHGAGDTWSDVIFGLAGGAAYLALRRSFAASLGTHASRGPPDEKA
jgi:hypothetical protein